MLESLVPNQSVARRDADWGYLFSWMFYMTMPENVCFIPIYILGLLGWSLTCNTIMLLMVVGMVIGLLQGVSLMEACLEHRPDEQRQLEELRDWMRRPVTVCGVELCGVSQLTYNLAMTLPLYVEIPQTLLAAGLSRRSWSGAPARRWSQSWDEIPVLGPVIGSVGLPDLLAIVTIASHVWCFVIFSQNVRKGLERAAAAWPAREADSDGPRVEAPEAAEAAFKRGLFYSSFTGAADVANLGLLGKCGAQLRLAESNIQYSAHLGGRPLGPGTFDHGYRFQYKIALGTAPRLFLKGSLLMDNWGGLMEDWVAMMSMLIAIGSGLFGIASVIPDWVDTIRHWQAQLEITDDAARPFYRNISRFLFTMGLTAVIIVRLVGTCFCDSHLFNLSTGCIPPHAEAESAW